jgi:DNA-binding beta-propeller fold protein YncE
MGDPAIGSTLAGYRIDAVLGRGGMGVVYRATHLTLERPVALKVIAPNLADREGFRERFLRESRLAASLEHPAVVPVYDSREVDGELIVAMRLVSGGDLRRLIDREGPLQPARALALLGQVAEALDAAHAAGIVHRDVKPHNVLVEGDRAFLSDFGLAKALGESTGEASVVGTAHYMSPEQWRGERVGPAADVYSLGCVLYEALTGVVPYARRESESEPEMPDGMEAVVERAVASDPGRRYSSAGALIAAAREREGAAMAATGVLSAADRPTLAPAGLGAEEGATAPLDSGRDGGARPRLRDNRYAWVGGAVGLLGVVAALVLLLFGGESVEVSAPIAVGAPPLRVAAGKDGVWVTSERDGTVTRLDPESGDTVWRRSLPGADPAGVAIGGRWLWATDPAHGRLLRLDPDTGRLLQSIDVGGSPGPIALGGGRVWVADEKGAGITAVNAEGGRVYRRGLPPQAAPLRLAVGAGGLWVSSASTGAVRRIDLSSLGVGEPIPVGRGPAGVTVAGGLVWVANSRSDTVTRVDPSIHAPLGDPVEVGGRPGGIDSGTGLVWVASSLEGTVSRLDIKSGEPVGGPLEVGEQPGAVAVGSTAVWVADNGEGAVTRIEP